MTMSTPTKQLALAVLSLLVPVVVGCKNEAKKEPIEEKRPKPPSDTRVLVDTLFAIASGAVPEDASARWTERIESGKATKAQLVDELIRSPRLGRDVLPSLIFGPYLNVLNYYALPSGYVLQKTEPDDEGKFVYYLRRPCKLAEAVEVHPWWDLRREVLVCPDSYRPKRWAMAPKEHAYKSEMPLSCDSQVGSPEKERSPLCGCGPNLIRCLKDFSAYKRMHSSMKEEIEQTTAHVVENDLPMRTLFTANATFRDRNVEYLYRRRRIGSLSIAEVKPLIEELAAWPIDGKWAKRTDLSPGQHAGVLTASQILHWLPDRRQRQRGFFEILWCKTGAGFGATTERVLEVSKTGNLAFVHETWKRLAKLEYCTDCHARMDYGFQFFMGYPDSRASTHFVPSAQLKGTGPLYGDDIEDHRGDGPLTPLGFAELATAQPEFAQCMSRKITEYVLADRAEQADHEAVLSTVQKEGTFRSAMKTALFRMVARWDADPTPPKRTTEVVSAAPGDEVRLSVDLREMVKEHCVECHITEKFVDPSETFGRAFDLRSETLPRALVLRMADQVAFGRMPKAPAHLSNADRGRFVRALIDNLFADPAARRDARTYYLGKMEGLPVHQVDAAIDAIESAADGVGGIDWGLLERGIYMEQSTYSPGYAATTALQALRACKRAGAKGDALEACVDRATEPRRFVRTRIH